MQKYRRTFIHVNNRRFIAIIADSSIKRMIGLMFRKGLGMNQCMLFMFPNEGLHSIWMHNMLFAIDAVWIDKRLSVVDVKKEIKPCNSFYNCATYSPKKESKYIIEFRSGTAKRYGIRIGSRLRLSS
jgi:uncharacterized protein